MKSLTVLLTRCQTQFAKTWSAKSVKSGPGLLYVYLSPVLHDMLTLRQRIKLSRFQKWQNRYRRARSSNGLNAGLRRYLPSRQYIANDPAEIGDFVEQDEEIATIETDKVHTYAPGYSFTDTPSPIRLTSL